MSDDDKVVTFTPPPPLEGRTAAQELNRSPALIEWLEEMLRLAKKGEVKGVAGSILYDDNTAAFYVMGMCGGYGMIGALAVASNHLSVQAAEDAT